MHQAIIPVAVAVALAAPVAPALANADYVFSVPVTASHLHANVANVGVQCLLQAGPNGPTQGLGAAWTAVPGAAADGAAVVTTLTVEVDLNADAAPGAASHYMCRLLLQGSDGTMLIPVNATSSNAANAGPRFHHGETSSWIVLDELQ